MPYFTPQRMEGENRAERVWGSRKREPTTNKRMLRMHAVLCTADVLADNDGKKMFIAQSL